MENLSQSETYKRRALYYFFQAGKYEERANEYDGPDREFCREIAYFDRSTAYFLLKFV